MNSVRSICEHSKRSRVRIQIFGVIPVFLLSCLPAFSQLNYGRILGTVTDQTGGAIVGSTVTVTDTDRGVTRTLVTDSAGEYNAPSLLPSTYTVRAEAKGFRTLDRQNLMVGVGQEIRVDLTLQPGEQTQTVTVTEALPMIETTNAELGGTLQNQLFNELPVSGRLYTKLLEFVPGVSSKPGGSTPNFSSNGAVGSAQDWMIDGVSALNIFDSGGPLVGVNSGVDNLGILPLDSIQEVNVIEIPRAEYGWVPGAQINVGLKSGTNNFHGTADALGRDTALDARNPFLGSTLPKGIDQLEQFGASIGGPIKKDKLFFFGAYEGERFAIGSATANTIPTTASLGDTSNSLPDAIADINGQIAKGVPGVALSPLSLALAGCPSSAALAGVTNPAAINCVASNGVFGNTQTAAQGGGNVTQNFLNTGRSNDGIVKIDYHLNDHNALNGEYYFARANSDTPDGIQSYWEDFNSNRVDLLRAIWVWTPNSSWVNEARFGWDQNHNLNAMAECEQPNGSSNTAAPPNYQASFGLVSGAVGNPPENCGFPLVTINNSATLGANAGSGEPSSTYDAVNNTSYTRGKHAFKFGGEFHHDRFSNGTSHLTNITGAVNFGTGGINAFPSASGLEDFLTGVNSGGGILLGTPTVTFGENRYALFGEDDYRVNRRVLVNVGLRWEWRPAIAAADNNFGTFDPTTPTGLRQQVNGEPLFHTSWPNFGPRVGVAWDVTGNGKTVVRAGASIVDETLVAVTLYVSMDKTPTGFGLYQANGTKLASAGNIQFGNVSLLPGQISWAQNAPVFNTSSNALVCANGSTRVTVGGIPEFPSPCNLNVEAPNLNPSYVSSWNVSVQHAFTNNLALTIAYVGNHLTDGLAQLDVNQPLLGSPNGRGVAGSAATVIEQQRRPYYNAFPYLGQILQTGNNNSSNYNSVQASLVERVSRGLSFSVKYAYQHSLTTNDGSITTWSKVMNSYDPQLDYGNNGFIPFQDFGVTATYAIPARKSPGQLLEGWEINTTITAQGVRPFNPADTSADFSGTGESLDRWTLVGNHHDFVPIGAISGVPCFGAAGSRFAGAVNGNGSPICGQGLPQPCINAANGEAVNAAMNAANPGSSSGMASLNKYGCYMEGNSVIVPPAQGTYGTMSRNELTSVPFREWDLSVNKLWKVKERYSAQFRAEFFNVLNSREYGSLFTNISNPATFGLAKGTPNNTNPVNGTGGPREIQLGLVLRF